jgi:hypothetical protein
VTPPCQSDFLVRLGPPARGETIHRDTCRYAQLPNALRWKWVDDDPTRDWQLLAPWLNPCKVCRPPSPFRPEVPR